MHYPSEVTWSDGSNSHVTCWADYALAPDAMYETAQGVVCNNFWVSFFKVLSLMHLTLLMLNFEIAEMIPLGKRRHADHMRIVFEKNSHKLVSQSISNGWIHVSNEYLQTVEGQQMVSFRDGSDTYMSEEQYAMVKHVGLNFISCLLCFY
jgi:hypothetical protein